MSAPGPPPAQFPVRLYLPNDQILTMRFGAESSIAHIRDAIWDKNKLPLEGSADDYSVKLTRGNIFFKDSDTLSQVIDLHNVFLEDNMRLLELQLLPKNPAKEKANRPLSSGIIWRSGYMWKRGSSKSSKWKQRFFVIQQQTLHWFHNQEDYEKGKDAIDSLRLGTCAAVVVIGDSRPLCFSLNAEHIKGKNYYLSCDDEMTYKAWIGIFNMIAIRLTKTIVVSCVQEVERRGLTTEGLFRVAGSRDGITHLKSLFDQGLPVDLPEVKDIHTITGVLKLAIRELKPEPLLTYHLYDDFVSIAQLPGEEEVVAALKRLFGILPQASQSLLQYLIHFLMRVCKYSDSNMMTSQNLSIVFGPNILRPYQESLSSNLNESGFVLAVVKFMIDFGHRLFDLEGSSLRWLPHAQQSQQISSAGTPKQQIERSLQRQLQPKPAIVPTTKDADSDDSDDVATPVTAAVASPAPAQPKRPPPRTPLRPPQPVKRQPKSQPQPQPKPQPQQRSPKPLVRSAPQTHTATPTVDPKQIESAMRALLTPSDDVQVALTDFAEARTRFVEGYPGYHFDLQQGQQAVFAVWEELDGLIRSTNHVPDGLEELLEGHLIRSLHWRQEAIESQKALMRDLTRITEQMQRDVSLHTKMGQLKQSICGPSSNSGTPCIAIYDFSGGHRPDELLLKENDQVFVTQKDDTKGWWFGKKDAESGWFPASYVREL